MTASYFMDQFMRPRYFLTFLLAIHFVCSPWASCAIAETVGVPTLAEKRAARSLVGKFRRARRDMNAQAQVLAEAMQMGPYAVQELQKAIESQLTPLVAKYRQQFSAIASGAAEQKFARADKNEVAQLQAQVNALRDDPQLSKEQIKAVGDPGMDRLAKVLLVDRVEILSSNKKLVDSRQSILPVGKLWETADAYLDKFAPKPAAGDDGAESPADESRAVTFDEYLVQEEEIAVRLALPMNPATKQVLQANEQLAKKLDAEEARCVLSLNLTRILLGLEPLVIDLKLTDAARDHSHDMREQGFFAHESPVPGKKTPWDRAARFGTSASGENIAAGYGTGPAANLAWFHSPGHHKNMLGDHIRVGVGRDAKHWTELFGR